MNPKISVLAGALNGSTITLIESPLTIGREPRNQLSIPDRLLSRRHCQLSCAETLYTLTDLGSVNGTFVNGVPIKERVLRHGDLIQVGESLLLFEQVGTGAATAASGFVQWNDAPLSQVGTLTLARASALEWSPEHLHQLSVNARLAQEFQAVLRIGLELNQLRKPEDIEHRLLASLREIVPAERGIFLLWEHGEWAIGSSFGWEGLASAEVKVSRTIVQQVMQQGVATLYQNIAEETALQQAHSLLYAGVKSVMAVPLATDDKVFGVLYFDLRSEQARFDRWHLQLVTALANLTAHTLQRAHALQRAEAEAQRLQNEMSQSLIGEGALMQRVRLRLAQFAPTDATVLILGESGAGKEVVAQALHQASPRAQQPFIAINCANLMDTLLESELFGHEKGAFTGANALKKGKFELAEGGTVFLDEIGEMKPELQAKLLRVLEERQCERLGSTRPIKLDVRILAATNRDLSVAMQNGSFRSDLYYRLNVFTLTLPPLRERRDDIELLARFFINRFAQKNGRRVSGLAATTIQCLQSYDWPGNVRELRNAMEYAVTLNTTGIILPEDLPARIFETESPLPLSEGIASVSALPPTAPLSSPMGLKYRDAIKAARQQIILQAFEQNGGDHQAAAQSLGLHPNNLYREIRLLGLKLHLKSLP